MLFVTDCLMFPPADLAAIPDFQSGAMENWGLTTYRETGLLFDPDKSSASDKLGITKVIAHELAHQVAAMLFFFFFIESNALRDAGLNLPRGHLLCAYLWFSQLSCLLTIVLP